jgi:N-acetylglucosaminyldiphosphoundecaprenol N-acetyl-beta-D-mannosaminyltransferase
VKKQFFNLDIHVTDQEKVLIQCGDILNSNETKTLFFLNAHCFNVAQKDSQYADALKETDILLNDGIGLKIASFFTSVRFQENLNGTDLIPKIIALASQNGKNVFFFGGKPGIAKKAAKNVKSKFPDINISGTHSGYFESNEERLLLQEIDSLKTDLLIVGMGVPKQEIWIKNNKKHLKNVKLIIAGGAIIDFLSEEIERAPLWMRKTGLEWVYRLILEPRRMWKRYLVGNLVFFYHILRLKLNFN